MAHSQRDRARENEPPMTSKRSNTACAKGRDIAPGVPAQKGSVMEDASDNGRLADATGLSSASPIEPVPVSPVPASIPSAEAVEFVREWMMSGDHQVSDWEREFAAAIDARSAPLLRAAEEVLAMASSTYRARNGRIMSIEADDGEKCWIVHSDAFDALCFAVAQAIETQSAKTEGLGPKDESAVAKPCAQGDAA